MLHDGLAGAERTGDRCRAPLGDREEGVNDTLTGLQRYGGRILLFIGSAHTHRPLLHKRQLFFLVFLRFEHGDNVGDGEAARLDAHQRAAHLRRHHDLVEDRRCFLHGAEDVAADKPVTDAGSRDEVPLFFPIQRRDLNAARQAVAARCGTDDLQRTLDAVVNIFDQTGTELDRKRRTGRCDLRPRTETRGLFIYLNRGGISAHGQDLADETLLAHADNVSHVGLLHTRGDDQRTGDFHDLSHRLYLPFLIIFISYPRRRRVLRLFSPAPSQCRVSLPSPG